MPLPLSVHGATDRGLVHDKNEDSWAIVDTDEGGRLLVVCDGMGGMGRGDEASQLAVEVLTAEMLSSSHMPPESLRSALRVADVRVRDALCNEMTGLPGSTAVLVYVMDGAAHVAWVGDSRAYLLRGGKLIERTRDHKLVEELLDAGQITPEEAKHSTLAHVVTRALGGRGPDDPAVRPSTLDQPWRLDHGDRILLCSDGVCDLVTDDEIAGFIDDVEPATATDRLVQVSLERGGHDNITAIVAVWDGHSWVEDDAATPLQVQRLHAPDGGLDEVGRVTEEIQLDDLENMALLSVDSADAVEPDILDDDPEPTLPSIQPVGATEIVPVAGVAQRVGPVPAPAPSALDRVSTHAILFAGLVLVLSGFWWLIG